jgi:hypothetical protein
MLHGIVPFAAVSQRANLVIEGATRIGEQSMSKDNKKTAAEGSSAGGPLGRRLFFFRVATILTGAAATAVAAPRRSRAQESDSDTGANADPSGRGHGRGNGNSNTDSDWGANRDPVGGKKAATPTPARQENGATDSDSGPSADPRGKGRGSKK